MKKINIYFTIICATVFLTACMDNDSQKKDDNSKSRPNNNVTLTKDKIKELHKVQSDLVEDLSKP